MGFLDEIRVIDLGQYVAGPLTAMILADEGADVIHVEPQGGPRLATTANASVLADIGRAGDLDALVASGAVKLPDGV